MISFLLTPPCQGGSIGFLVVVFLRGYFPELVSSVYQLELTAVAEIKFGLGRMVSFEELPDFLMVSHIPLFTTLALSKLTRTNLRHSGARSRCTTSP